MPYQNLVSEAVNCVRISFIAIVFIVGLVLASCSGNTQPQLLEEPVAVPAKPATEAALSAALLAEEAEQDVLWQAILADPGTPGLDYDPRSLTVNFAAEPVLADELQAVPEPGLRSADMSNAILRKNDAYPPIADAIAARYGLAIDQQVYLRQLNFATFKVPEAADAESIINLIRSEFAGAIEDVTYSRLIYPCFSPNDPMFSSSSQTAGAQWGQKMVGCEEAWDRTKGDPSVLVAVVDTGAYLDHEDLSGQVLDPLVYFPGETLDIANNDNTMEDHPDDGHGTFLCGLVAANTNNGKGMAGVAPDCRIIPVKISDEGAGNQVNHGTFVAGCMLGFELGAKVVNLSWRSTGGSGALKGMVNDIYIGGGLLFVSAGNDGNANKTYPASYLNAVAVGNSTNVDTRHHSSSYGDWVDIAAPGVALSSTGHHDPTDYHGPWNGTSFSAPITAAAAALLWTYEPTLTNDEIRTLLETTGPETTGFNISPDVVIRRLDIAAAFDELSNVKINPPQLDQLVYSGVVTLDPGVFGEVTQVDVLFNGAPATQKFAAPWTFDIDTTAVTFGVATVHFIGYGPGDPVSAQVDLLVDNTTGKFPIIEPFGAAWDAFAPLDLKNHSQGFLESIKFIPTGFWTPSDVTSNGPAVWTSETTGSFDGTHHARFGAAGETHGNHEIDALVSRTIDLRGVTDPTLVFNHHYNIEDGGQGYDRGWIYVTADSGQTFTAAQIRGGGDSYYSGYVADWSFAEIDLSAFADQLVHLAFVFESDTAASGEQNGQPDGWWIDEISIATNYQETMPMVDEVLVEPSNVLGSIPGTDELSLSVTEPQLVHHINYAIDYPPYNQPGDANDLELVVSAGDTFPAVFNLTNDPSEPNKIVILRVQYFDEENNPGIEHEQPVYIFNHLGDTNADGVINQGDLDGFNGKIGLGSSSMDYVPFFDSDLDGTITEADISAVGYFWGNIH